MIKSKIKKSKVKGDASIAKKVTIVAIICVLLGIGTVVVINMLFPGELEEPTGEGGDISTFTLISNADGEEVSSWVEISLWVPDSDHDDEGFSKTEDRYKLTNFEEEVKSKDAEDVSFNLSLYKGPIWLEIDPDGLTYFEHNFHLLVGGANYNFTKYVYHRPSDVSINVLDVTDLDEWDRASNIDGVVILDVPYNSTNELHKGTDWDISTADYAALDAEDQADVRNQRYYRSLASTYNPTDDDAKEYDSPLERFTDCPAVRFLFNCSINQTDGSVHQVNFTIHDRDGRTPPIEVVYASNVIYCIFYETITFINGPYTIDFRIDLAANISDTSVYTCWLPVPRKDSNLGTPTLLSAAPI